MKISFRTQGVGVYTTLGDDTAGTLIMGFIPRMGGIAQVSPLFRAANALVAARGNRTWDVSGTIDTQHADAATAASFMQTQAAAVPDFVDLKIEQDGTAVYLTPAVLVRYEPTLVGRSSKVAYGFVGGNLTSVAP